MHSLIIEIAKRLDRPPNEIAEAVDMVFVRVRAALETTGEAEIEGLGTFRSVDGQLSFEPAHDFANEINKEFAGMKAVALTPEGESVPIHDDRAIPGVVSESDEGSSEPDSEPEEQIASVAIEEIEEELPAEPAKPEVTSTFTSPPPPIPSKVRVPPREKRAVARLETAAKETVDIPDMGPIVSTRPVERIHTGVPKRTRSKTPLFLGVAAVVIVVGSWLIIGGSEGDSEVNVPVADTSPGPDQHVVPAAEPEFANPEEDTVAAQSEVMEARTEEMAAEEDPVATSVPEPVVEEVVEEVAVVDEPEVVVETPAPPPVSGPIYAWIVASSPSEAEAQSRIDGLNESGFNASIYRATVRGEPTFRIGVGQFASEAAALQNRALVPQEITDAWVTRVK